MLHHSKLQCAENTETYKRQNMPIVYNKQPVLRNISMHHLFGLYIASITARYLVLLEFKAVNFTCHSSTHEFLLIPNPYALLTLLSRLTSTIQIT
jgi:hypothetical protein